MLLQLLLVVVVSRLVTGALRTAVRSQLSAALSAVVTGAVMAFFFSGWFVFVNLDDLTERGVPQTVATAARVAPTGWGMVAVEAAAEGRWAVAAGALAGVAALIVCAFLAWALLLERRLTTRRSAGGGRVRAATRPAAWAASPVGGVVRKELLTWRRDYTRGSFLFFAFFYSGFVCLYPLTADVNIALPLIGVVFVLTAAGSTANLYGADGSALWLTLTRPEAARADVRGRQLAWLAVTGPVALLSTLVAVAVTDLWVVLPGALALVVAVLGAGAGLTVLHSVYRPTAMADPHKRGDDMFDHGIEWSQFMALLVGLAVVASPVWGLIWLAIHQQATWPQWAALGVAVPLSVASYLGFGALAYRRLAARGPELLTFLQHGRTAERARPGAKQGTGTLDALPARSRATVYLAGFVGVIALFPQGLVPLIRSLVEDEPDPVWFLALFLPDPWRWVVIAVMITIGVVGSGYAAARYLAARR
jgi:ABC-2 type transport system permease protein